MIRLINFSKEYKNLKLFENVNYTFEKGKKYIILGENGSGKSVLLKCIVGYSIPSSGVIEDNGKPLGDEVDFLKDCGVSINAPEFMSALTGMENLLKIAAINKKVSKEEIDELVKTFSLTDSINKKYKYYSLGMRQKLRIIQAVMEKPQYLILDEPYDALDKESKFVLQKFLDDYINEDRILIYTSHDLKAQEFADHVLSIENYDLV